MAFFAQVSRHFITDLAVDLSRTAWRVYAYLRTWCISEPGAGSGWRELRLAKIAADLGWTVRNVQYGLRELVQRELVQRREQFETLDDGRRAQRPNLWRIAPEPGFPTQGDEKASHDTPPSSRTDVVPADPDPEAPPPTPDDPLVQSAIDEQIEEVCNSVPAWAQDAADRLQTEIEAYETALADLEQGAPEAYAGQRAELQTAIPVARAERTAAQLAAHLPPMVAAIAPEWLDLVISTIAHRAQRTLVASGMRARHARRALTPDRIEAAIRRAMG